MLNQTDSTAQVRDEEQSGMKNLFEKRARVSKNKTHRAHPVKDRCAKGKDKFGLRAHVLLQCALAQS
jgi:hypothetical protein